MSHLEMRGVDSRRRIFWSTQPTACGIRQGCKDECGSPGLYLTPPTPCGKCSCCLNSVDGELLDPTQTCITPACSRPRTIATNDWVRGLTINMLMTDARMDPRICGYRPGSLRGHWSESFIQGGAPIGTSMRYVGTLSSITDSIKLVSEHAKYTLQKLVRYGIVLSVEVAVTYKGGNALELVATLNGQGGEIHVIGLTGTRLKNSWAWS